VLLRLRVILMLVFMGCFSVCLALPATVHHPLDSLTLEEYWKSYNLLQAAGKLSKGTLFTSVLLHEPPKAEVLAWRPGQPIPRKVDVVLLTDGKSYEAVVDLTGNKIESYKELKNYQAPITETEMHSFDDVLKYDPRVQAALKARGITDTSLVLCYVTPAGYVGLEEQKEGRRIGWGGCTYSANSKFAWDREIPGIFFVVDMKEKKIVRFSDYGAAPLPPTTSLYDADGGPALPGTKPILT
jgi:primary-amine oxidase